MRQIRYWGSYIGMTCGLTLLSSLLMTALSLLRGGMAELALAGVGMYYIPYLFFAGLFCMSFSLLSCFQVYASAILAMGLYEKTVPARGTGSGADRGSGAGRRECTVGATW